MNHLLQLRAGDLLFLQAGLLVNELRLLHHVAGAEEQNTFARQAVAARAAGFLVIALDVFRQVVMDDEADVWLVDAMRRRWSRRSRHVVAQKKLLMLGAFFGVSPA